MKLGDVYNPHGLFRGVFVPEALLRWPEVSAGAKLCFGRLAYHAGKDGRCFPSTKALASALGVSERQSQFYVKELENSGLVRRVFQAGGVNRFEFLWHEIFEGTGGVKYTSPPKPTSPPTPETSFTPPPKDTSPGGEISFAIKRRSKRSIEENKNTHDASASFESEFWTTYPRKVGKAAALKAWKKRYQEKEKILEGLKAQLPELAAREQQYIPHPATWLNQERWTDEPAPPQTAVAHRKPDKWEAHQARVSQIFEERMLEEMERRK